jgi:hypothetical protein
MLVAVPSLRNAYFTCLNPAREPVAWNPPEVAGDAMVGSAYFGAVLAAMDERLAAGGLTVYLTQDLEALPSYGPDVVALVVGDELARIPAYAHRVRATFKNHSARPVLTSNFLREPSWVNLWWGASYLRAWRHHLPGALARRRAAGGRAAPIWMLPTGVLNQCELELKPIEARATDVFFAGSVTHMPNASRLKNSVAPKVRSRVAMVRAADALAAAHADVVVQLTTTSAFADSIEADPDVYSRRLMDARLALVPRGTTADTFRFWEALRYGAVPIVDAPPRHPFFYDGAPVVRVSRWRDLGEVIPPLLKDPDRLRALHERSLDWWRTRGSPEAVGGYMARRLDELA